MLGSTLIEQFDTALGNVVTVVRACGGMAGDIVSMTIFTTRIEEYRGNAPALSPVWRRHMGGHYPAMALVGVTALVEPAAVVEIAALAVVPAAPGSDHGDGGGGR